MSDLTWHDVPPDVVKIAADMCDGHSIREPSDFVEVGVPAELVEQYTEALESDFSDPKQTIHAADTGKPLGAVVGVYGLHMLEGMVKDFRLKCAHKFGRGSQARVYQEAISNYLAKKTPRTSPLATRVRIAESELDQIKPGTELYKRAVDSLEEAREGWIYIQRAEHLYAREGEIEIDDDAAVSLGADDGAYVQGWLWVPDEEEDEDDA
jgi:hypothetical protein